MNISEFLQQVTEEVGKEMDRVLPRESGDAEKLYAAMRYSVFSGGKRLRPALFCAALDMFDIEYRRYLPMAAAMEMIHCYSLIHDDLPAMDDDSIRRGRPTSHVVYGEAMAILAGDGLLTLGTELLMRPLERVEPARQLAAAGQMLAGAGRMVAGQAAELAAGAHPDQELLRRIYLGKTAGLFSGAVLAAAALAGAGNAQQIRLDEFSANLGLTFQIADDVLDVRGDQEKTGRPAGSDARNDKQTAAALLGCDAALVEAEQYAAAAEQALDSLPRQGGLLRLFPRFLVDRAR